MYLLRCCLRHTQQRMRVMHTSTPPPRQVAQTEAPLPGSEVQGLITVLLCGGVVDDRLIIGLLEMEQAYRRRALVLKFHFEYHKLMCMLSVFPVSVITRGDFLPGLRGFDGPQGVRTELQCCSGVLKLRFAEGERAA